ncbi:hypothetical protein PHYSODRAFT_502813 [Phytophthora sojae]|uniref:Transmembrane protein n=1 Tax=Phytophthora sojae (strain P6497) TaxID=1094619 RepID=G4ZJE3_PHYSP|nr:hypothetical protein PHYSODRAFT_502813 [Phytophthora sojae]EGZ18217.1 hypothetical protein PHYSODRAFT_502813 [Phytophthora sojae]|eukprot:XP_009527275.1 hypothetical protein PHYSODRAFT_502813 [Phytophthora sojae]
MATTTRVYPASNVHQSGSTRRRLSFDPVRAWQQLQVSYYGGKYSLHRAFALRAYSQKTSLSRALLVVLGTPFPTVVFVIVEELIPLQKPEDGWVRNYGFWIRTAILVFVVGHTNSGQARYLVDAVDLSERQVVLLCAWTTVIFTMFAVLVASQITFPVPFFVITMAPMFFVLLVVSFCIMVGRQQVYEIWAQFDQLLKYFIFVGAQVMVAMVYPLYESLFRAVQGSPYQFPVILLLPVIKLAVKYILLRCTKHMEDMIPEAIIFTVDFFNAIYMATCMQSATSDASIVAMTVLDISQTSAMLYGLHRRTNTLQLKLRLAVGSDSEGNDLLAMLCTLCRDVKKFKRQVRAGIQLRSCFPHKLDDDDQYILQNLRNNASNSKIISTDPTISVPRTYNMHGVAPNAQNLVAVDRRASTRASIQSLLHPAHPTILLETLEALFTIECILLTAYLEAAIPMFYCCYMLLLVNFPSAQYHTEMVGITLENVEERVVPLVLFGLFQLLSFRLLVRMIKRNCGMDAIKHLAFVLDKHMPLIQGKLTLWMAVTVCCRVVHFGASSAFFFC